MTTQTRSVVLYELISIDGVAEEPSDFVFEVDDDVFANLARVIGRQDDVLLGRGTYDYWAGYWPTAQMQPFADFINTTTKHVFTSRAVEQEWPASTFVSEPAEEYVADLKQRPGGDIGIHGSITLAQSLLDADLVDELRLVLVPTLAGRGRRLFEGERSLRRFELADVAGTPTGAALLGYRRAD